MWSISIFHLVHACIQYTHIHACTWISTKNTENQSLSKHINIYSSLEFPHCIVHSWMPSFITPASCHNKIFQFSSEFH